MNVLSPPRYPTTSGALKTVLTPFPPATTLFPHSRTGFVTRFRFPAGGPGTLVWSTYFGGNFDDYITGLAVDDAGAVVVAGGTRSQDYPTTRGAFDRTYAGEYIGAPFAAQPDECFVASIRGDGSALLYSTFLGGSGADCALDDFFKPVRIVTMGANTVAIAGSTVSPDFPATPGVVQPAYTPGPPQFAPAEDGFTAKLALEADASGDLAVGTPALLTPANAATFPTTGDITLRWNDVADPSGIEAYVYQISTRPDFPRDFIQYTGSVSTPSFLARSLSSGTHYWRVQAADRAGNLGAFSPAFSFTTGVAGANPVLAFIRLDPQRVNGGTASSGTLFLNFGAVAPAGGAVVTLRSGHPGLVTVPATATIPAGANSAPFAFTTSAVAATTSVAIIGELGLTQTATLTLEPASVTLLRSLTLSPTSVTAGAGATGTVTLSNPAPTGGAVVALSSNNPSASVPLNVTVAAGATSATFPISTSAVTVVTSVNISAGYGTGLFATLTVNPGSGGDGTLASLALNPTSVVGGVSSQGTITLSGPAPSGGAVVTLSSSNTNVATVPASVTVAAGSASAAFTVTTRSVSSSTTVTITAARGGVTRTAGLTVTRLAAPTLLSPASGSNPAQPVTLDWGEVPGAASYILQVDDSDKFSTPLVVNQTVTASQFTAGSLASRKHWWRVRAVSAAGTTGAFSSVRSFTPQAAASAPALSALSVSPTSVVGGTSSQGTATLTAAAPTGGAVVALSSSNTGVATVPASVTVAAGGTSATFTVTTQAVTASTSATITGSYGGATRTASLTVTPPAPPPPAASLSALSVSPTSVVGGTSSQGTATLTAAAPSGGAVVALSSSNTGVATVPASVTVAAGGTSATFTVTTQAVTASTSATITGSFGGATRTATLTVTPPAQTVTLTVTATGRSGERVVSSPAGISVSVGSTGSAAFASGTSITLSVSNGRDAIWSGACSSGGDKTRSCTFTLTGNASVGANVQ